MLIIIFPVLKDPVWLIENTKLSSIPAMHGDFRIVNEDPKRNEDHPDSFSDKLLKKYSSIYLVF